MQYFGKTKKPFWDVEENVGFVKVRAWDSNEYKVWNEGSPELIQNVADTLANVRRDINTLLQFLIKNPDLWFNNPIAWGMIHTFDLHCPGWTPEKIGNGNSFNYQEMTPNDHGILGLNKPKVIEPVKVNGKDYEIGVKRSIFLTLRNKKMDKLDPYKKILDLAIHELTHTTCNDCRWKQDNHAKPYPQYHSFMRECCKKCGVFK